MMSVRTKRVKIGLEKLECNKRVCQLCFFWLCAPTFNLSPYEFQKVHLWTSKRTSLGELISCIFALFYPFIHEHFHHIDQDLAMFRLHFAYMSPYQVFEYHMEFLETLGGIWSSKRSVQSGHWASKAWSDQSGATPPSRSDLSIGATLPERQGEVARGFITRRRENEPGATSRSDTARSLPKLGATCRSDSLRSLRVLFLLELVISQGPFGHFIMHVFIF